MSVSGKFCIVAAGVLGLLAAAPASAQTKWNLPAAYAPDKPDAPNGSVFCVDDDGGATSSPCTNATAYTTIQAAVNAAATSWAFSLDASCSTDPDRADISAIGPANRWIRSMQWLQQA